MVCRCVVQQSCCAAVNLAVLGGFNRCKLKLAARGGDSPSCLLEQLDGLLVGNLKRR